MSRSSAGRDRERAFRSVYESTYADLLRFVQRRSPPHQVDDVVADAYLVVWRRLDELPASSDDARAWVFGIARHVLLTRQRGERRRRALAVRLADPPSTTSARDVAELDPAADEVASKVDLVRAWRRLSDTYQEAISLAALDGLTAPEAAAVLGISPVAFRLRLSRARHALRRQLAERAAPHEPRTIVPERTTAS